MFPLNILLLMCETGLMIHRILNFFNRGNSDVKIKIYFLFLNKYLFYTSSLVRPEILKTEHNPMLFKF